MGCKQTTVEDELDFNEHIPDEIILNNNKRCPAMGLGTALIKTEEDINIIYQSIIDGIRLIDVQPNNEELVGKGIKKAIDEKKVRRENLFIVAKLELQDKDDPEKALRKTLKNLQLEYVDLYLDHWPSIKIYKTPKSDKLIPIRETWEKIERLVDLKLTKSIGVSNYNIVNLLNILSCYRIKPVVNEVEFHPYLYQKDLKEFCDFENITLFAYNPFVKGEYCKKDLLYNNNYDLFKEGSITYLYRNEQEKKITKGQIILNWYLSLGIVPLVGTSKTDRMKENLQAKNFSMNRKIIDLIGSLEDKQHRFHNGYDIFGVDVFA